MLPPLKREVDEYALNAVLTLVVVYSLGLTLLLLFFEDLDRLVTGRDSLELEKDIVCFKLVFILLSAPPVDFLEDSFPWFVTGLVFIMMDSWDETNSSSSKDTSSIVSYNHRFSRDGSKSVM